MPPEEEAHLLKNFEDGVLRLVLNRPHRRNAFSMALYGDLGEALREAADDPAVGAVVLTGAGDTFSAGGDVKRMAGEPAVRPSAEERTVAMRQRSRISELLHTMDKPTIAMMRGPAIGAGLSMALACDMRFGDASVKMRTGFLNVGLSGDYGGHYFLPRLVGMAKARELYLMSPMLDAREALELGLLNRVVEAEALEQTVMQAARTLANGPRTAVAYMKRNLNDGLRMSLPELLDVEARRHVRCTDTADHKEAAKAWAEKRAPAYAARPEPLAEQ